jgi:hypothetical protein
MQTRSKWSTLLQISLEVLALSALQFSLGSLFHDIHHKKLLNLKLKNSSAVILK